MHNSLHYGRPLKVMIVAGEASSDIHAASFVKGLHNVASDLSVFGMGGSALRAEGVDTIVDSETSASVMGISEVVGSLSKILKAYRLLLNAAKEQKPDFVVLVDYPDFNLRLAKDLHKAGIRVFYFISPQLWAWRQGRVHTIKKYVDGVATIFPFEVDFYKKHGVNAKFVGHPFLDREEGNFSRESFLESLGLNPNELVVSLLPGSRKSEIERLLKPMNEAFAKLKQKFPALQGFLPVAPGVDIEELKRAFKLEKDIRLFRGSAYDALRASSASVVASGTATIEAALAGKPFFVVYKMSPLTYRIGRLLVRGISNFAMVNLVAGEKVVKELLQEEVNAQSIAEEIELLLTDKEAASKITSKLAIVRKNLQISETENISAGERAARMAMAPLLTAN